MTEVSLIRMTADGRLPAAERRGYTSALDAIMRISREEGVATLWRGTSSTITRAVVLNATQLAVYSEAKEKLASTFPTVSFLQGGITQHAAAATLSGFACTCTSLPVDIIKTRLQVRRRGRKGGREGGREKREEGQGHAEAEGRRENERERARDRLRARGTFAFRV